MSHGIDTKYDRVYSSENSEWHGLAIVKEEIKKEEIGEILFPIIESPAFVQVDGTQVELPNHKVLCADHRQTRPDLEEGERIVPLHVPKNSYQIISNAEIWEVMEKSLKGLGAKITSAGTLECGKKFFVSADIGDTDCKINGDDFKFYMNYVSSHDGTIASNVYDSGIRIVCMNTFRASLQAQGDVNFKVYHTKNSNLALSNLPELLQALLNGRVKVKEVMEFLAKCKLDHNEAIAFAAGYFAHTTNDIELSSRSMNAATEIATLFSRGIACKGETAYDLANASTQYWTSGNGVGRKGTLGSRIYKSSFGAAADHKNAFIDLLSDDSMRSEIIRKGKEAIKLAEANAK